MCYHGNQREQFSVIIHTSVSKSVAVQMPSRTSTIHIWSLQYEDTRKILSNAYEFLS